MAIPRLGDLLLSPGGERLASIVSQLDNDGGRFVSSLWALDADGALPARRLTRSSEGETVAAYLPDGSLLFASSRPRPSTAQSPEDKGEADRAALWLLPPDGGEPWLLAARPGGITSITTGLATSTVVIGANTAPGGVGLEDDREWWASRRKQKASAALFDGLPVRHWDHFLGPHETHLFAAVVPDGGDGLLDLRDLTPDAGQSLAESQVVLSPDGSTVVVEWRQPLDGERSRQDLVAIEVATGTRRTIASAEDSSFEYASPVISADGRYVAALRMSRATMEEPSVVDLWLIDLATGAGHALDAGDEPYPREVAFSPDGAALIVSADCGGRAPLFKVDIESGEVTRLTEEGAWSSIRAAPGSTSIFALRSAMDAPPRPVRLELRAGEGADFTLIDAPGAVETLPGRLEEIAADAPDGTPLRAWLVLPATAAPVQPAPLALWVHGGPVSSWNAWHWRWNPWLMAARGWAVLIPDPALSTGYGQKMIRRGWCQWGGTPYDDLMTVTDAALRRDDVDQSRTAAMGASYGGYMANWIAGHTERFRAIVSHASLWALDQFQGTTDWPAYWADEWGYPDTNRDLYERWSPSKHVDAIRTPMLVSHGERDYRCPVGESLRLWADLMRRGVKARFLWFGDENHWILQPGDLTIWYETVFAFLDEHVLGEPWRQPEML